MPEARETVLEINLKSLKHNFNHLKSKLDSQTRFMAVVKAYAYGSDPGLIAKFLESLGVDYFAVAYTREGIALREAGITTPILVLHPQPVNLKNLITHNLEPGLYNFKVLTAFIAEAEKQNLDAYPAHIKFNTGLNRLGFTTRELDDVVARLKTTTGVRAKSLFSHLAASEDLSETDFTLKQISAFGEIAQRFIDGIGYKPLLHLCNTSGILNYPQAHLDMVRSGIGLYGFGNSEKENKNLRPIASLKSVISQIHDIAPGESVGYNMGYRSETHQRTATIPIGHADGIGRQYGHGKGFVTIHGQQAPFVGNVCMDMIMVNITDIDCKEGDEVIVFDAKSTAETLANRVGTISYEIITAISPRIRRVLLP